MINSRNILETIKMVDKLNFDIRTVTMGISLLDCSDSDGNKLYRVFQNVIDNALRYSLYGTRIFIELEEYETDTFVSIKNISSSEINFTANEILQRFNRSDKHRTTEGSGLGLSIAESFTKVCGGDFKIDIDGDMFKVIISFKTIQLMD